MWDSGDVKNTVQSTLQGFIVHVTKSKCPTSPPPSFHLYPFPKSFIYNCFLFFHPIKGFSFYMCVWHGCEGLIIFLCSVQYCFLLLPKTTFSLSHILNLFRNQNVFPVSRFSFIPPSILCLASDHLFLSNCYLTFLRNVLRIK